MNIEAPAWRPLEFKNDHPLGAGLRAAFAPATKIPPDIAHLLSRLDGHRRLHS
jgi:hypothetical protein